MDGEGWTDLNTFKDYHRYAEVIHKDESAVGAFNPDRRIDVSRVGKAIENVFNPDARIKKLYTDRQDRVDQAKTTKCEWTGDSGDSRAVPLTDTPEGLAAADKLAELGQKDVRYRDGVVDFGPSSLATVRIEGMTKNRLPVGDDCGNYRRAYEALAEKWSKERPKADGTRWTAQDIKKWSDSENLTPHECSDMKTVQFVPREIHSYFKHYGGVAECKAREERERTSE